MFPTKYEIEIWHLTNSVFSILTIFGISKISSRLFNKKVGKIVFLLCFINPIFFGHMSMNSKDTIVAFAHVWTTYIFLRYLQNQNLNGNYNVKNVSKHGRDFSVISVPYSFKLLMQELQAMNIQMRIIRI